MYVASSAILWLNLVLQVEDTEPSQAHIYFYVMYVPASTSVSVSLSMLQNNDSLWPVCEHTEKEHGNKIVHLLVFTQFIRTTSYQYFKVNFYNQEAK